MSKMIVAIDYDETFSTSPDMWSAVIDAIESRGHRVICVTARHRNELDEVLASIGRIIGESNVFATGRERKREHMMLVHDIRVDVWIDDMPEWI